MSLSYFSIRRRSLTGASSHRWRGWHRPALEQLEERDCPSVAVWTGTGGDALWSNKNNWQGDRVPNFGSDVVITDGRSSIVDRSQSIHSLTLGGDSRLYLEGSDLSADQLNWSSGSIGGGTGSEVSISDGMTLSGQLNLDGASLVNAGGIASYDSGGTQDNIGLASGARFLNDGGATLSIANNHLFLGSGGETFENHGKIQVSGSASFQQLNFINDGLVTVSSGEVQLFQSTGAGAGQFNADNSSRVEFRDSIYTFEDGSKLNGSGSYVEAGTSTLTVNNDLAATNFELDAGFLTGPGRLGVNDGTFSWLGGTLAGSGSLDVFSGSNLVFSAIGTSGPLKLDSRTINNYGTVDWSGNVDLDFGDGSTFNNLAGATFNITSGQSILADFGTPGSIINSGFLFKDIGTTVFDTPVTNSGIIEVSTGTLNFSGGYTQGSGLLALFNGASIVGTVELQGGTLAGGGSIEGNLENVAGVVLPGFGNYLTVTGNFMQSSDGSLAVDVGGATAGLNDGQLQVGGTAAFDGTLALAWYDASGLDDAELKSIVLHAYDVMHFRDFSLPEIDQMLAYAAAAYGLGKFVPDPTDRFTLATFTSANGSFGAVMGGTESGTNFNAYLLPLDAPTELELVATEDVYWIGAGDGTWSDGRDWSTGKAPGPFDDVFFTPHSGDGAFFRNSTLDAAFAGLVHGVTLTSSWNGLLTLNSALSVSSYVAMMGGTIDGNGNDLDIDGLLTWKGGALKGLGSSGNVIANAGINLSGTETLDGLTLNVEGTVNWTGAGSRLNFSNGPTINNDGEWKSEADNQVLAGGVLTGGPLAGGFFVNGAQGSFVKSAGTGTTYVYSIIEDGTIRSESGTLALDGGGISDAAVLGAGPGAVLLIDGDRSGDTASYHLNDGTTLQGPGKIEQLSGEVSITGTVSADNYELDGGRLDGHGALTVNGMLN